MKTVLACLCLASGLASAVEFRAGVAAVDISPTEFPRIIAGSFLEKRGDKLTDPLFVRAFVLDDGKMKIAFAIVDTCMMEQALMDEAKGIASKQCGIPVDRMMVSATHTHSAPAAMSCLGTRKDTVYAKFLTPKIAEAIVAANAALQPARIGWGSFDDWEHTHNRRWIRLPGKEIVDPYGQPSGRAHMHPGYLSKDVVGPSGPVDPQLSVIALQTLDGKPLGVLANYSQHYFGSQPTSADYYGHFCRHLAAKMGQPGDGNGPFVCAMSQGTSGDQMWMDYGAEKKDITLDAYAAAVADSAMKALQTVKYVDHSQLGMIEKTLELRYRVPDEKRLAWARPIAAKIENDLPKDKEEVYAREALILHERQKTSVKLQAIRIGDLSIATLPNEVYAITGLKLREMSPLEMHFNIELANGAEGYIPPMEQHGLGGYTTWPARTAGLEVKAEPAMVDTLSKSISQIAGKAARPLGPEDGPFSRETHASKPVAHFRCDDAHSTLSNEFGAPAKIVGGHAFYLPGPGSRLGYDEESALRPSAFSGATKINRSIHLAGGHLETSSLKLGTQASIALWFWLGHESGASERTGELINALGVSLKAHQFADHTVKLEWGMNKERDLPSPSSNPDLASPAPCFADDWHFAVLIRDGENVRVHLDGSEKPVLTGKAGEAANEVLFGKGLEGRLDEITIWDRAIEPSLIAKLWSISKVGEENAQRAEWKKRPAAAPAAQKEAVQRTTPLSPEESAKKWHVREGYRIELVAAEPVVLDPVAFDWDEQGRLWVIEMADYPLGMDGNGKAGGRLVRLTDSDADGRYDQREIIADGLNFPTGVLTWRDGALVTAAPDIFFISPDGTKKVLYTGFSTGNQQLRVNGLRWGMDGWVYCAAGAHNSGYNKGTLIECKLTGEKVDLGSRDFRFKPDTGEFDPQTGPSQFGRARDDWGHWFGVQNSFPLWHYVLQDHYLRRNPHVIPPNPIHQLFPRNPPVHPASSMEKRFHNFDQAGRFTSACGIEVYRDRVLFEDKMTHAFSCEPFHNLVQHIVLEEDGVTFKAVPDSGHLAPRDEQTAFKSGKASKQENAPLISTERDGHSAGAHHDFLASEDRWCRPVMVRTGPDGALWVADMYRYMIEHPQWLPQNGKEELLPHYREGDDKGRIWRVVKSSHLAPRDEHTASKNGKALSKGNALLISQERDGYFASPNGWLRDKAQMRAFWDGKAPTFDPVASGIGTIADAWTALALGKLSAFDCIVLLNDDYGEQRYIREQALQMAEKIEWKGDDVRLLQMALELRLHDQDAKVRLQLACTLGELKFDWAGDLLAEVLNSAEAGSPLQGAALSSVLPHLERVCARADAKSFAMLLRCALATKNEKAITTLVTQMDAQKGLEELLAVLDEKDLSLAVFAKQVTDAKAREELEKMAARLQQAADSIQTAPTMESLALLASDREHRERVKALLPELWAKSVAVGALAKAREGGANSRLPLQAAAPTDVLRLIAKLQPQGSEQFLLEGWDQRTPTLRVQILETLLSNDTWTLALLQRPEAKSADAAMRARLMKHPKKDIATLAAKTFTDSTSTTRAAVLEQFRPALQLKGDTANGKTVFAQLCASCHELDGAGLPLGPDLRSVAQHDAEKLLNSILDPSAIIEPGFTAYHCTLKNGEHLYGIVAVETATSITFKLPGNLTRPVLRTEISSMKSTGTSLMPEGLEAALTPQTLADVIAYLQMPR